MPKPDRRRDVPIVTAPCPDCHTHTRNITLRTGEEVFFRCVHCGKVWCLPEAEATPFLPQRRHDD